MGSIFFIAISCFFLIFQSVHCFDKVVIWGHKLHSHTHSYIHAAFYKAFKHMGYSTYWFDNADDLDGFDFSNSLFLTEGQVDQNIPLRSDCFYILHHCPSPKYSALDHQNHCIRLRYYEDSITKLKDIHQIEPFVFYHGETKTLYMPWATDLLPHEIDAVKEHLPMKKTKKIYWVGTIGDGPDGNIKQLTPFKKACRKGKIGFRHRNPWNKPVSFERNLELVQQSYFAPTIVGTKQQKKGYIPCRIFKNISYGQWGVTNSTVVSKLFEGKKIVYNPDTYQLFFDTQKQLKKLSKEDLYAQMDFVRDNHTYLNRIQSLLAGIELLKKQQKK